WRPPSGRMARSRSGRTRRPASPERPPPRRERRSRARAGRPALRPRAMPGASRLPGRTRRPPTSGPSRVALRARPDRPPYRASGHPRRRRQPCRDRGRRTPAGRRPCRPPAASPRTTGRRSEGGAGAVGGARRGSGCLESGAMEDLLAEREFRFTARDFERVRSMIHARAGISLAPSKKTMVYSRLSRRLRELGLRDFESYLALLESDDSSEWTGFTNALTTNLTSFFREPYHFPILADHLRQCLERRRSLRI